MENYIEGGFILLSRQLLTSRIWKLSTSEQKCMVIECLFLANHTDSTWWDGEKEIVIKRGAFVTGRKSFAKEVNTSEQKVRTFWDKMKKLGFLTIKVTKQYSFITVCNYNRYQNLKNHYQPTNQPTSNQPLTNLQPQLKNIKNVKEDKEEKHSRAKSPTTPSTVVLEIVSDLNSVLNTSYKPSSKETIGHINARISEGFTKDDFKKVHRNMLDAWGNDPKMSAFLRPKTLYSQKFEGYLNIIKSEKAQVDEVEVIKRKAGL